MKPRQITAAATALDVARPIIARPPSSLSVATLSPFCPTPEISCACIASAGLKFRLAPSLVCRRAGAGLGSAGWFSAKPARTTYPPTTASGRLDRGGDCLKLAGQRRWPWVMGVRTWTCRSASAEGRAVTKPNERRGGVPPRRRCSNIGHALARCVPAPRRSSAEQLLEPLYGDE